nr:NAD(P)/FAD-dependent oxidoreductase [Psychromicrobium silvestre]
MHAGEMDNASHIDVIVVGGGLAGLSAALVAARMRLRVVVVDAGKPRNAVAAHSQGYLTRDGASPAELLRLAQEEVAAYGVELLHDEVLVATKTSGEFQLELASGGSLQAGQLVVATGVKDELPELPGLAELWGRDALVCPFCHGWEARDLRTVFWATSGIDLHRAALVSRLTGQLTVVGSQQLIAENAAALEQLVQRGVALQEGEVAALESDGDSAGVPRLRGVRLADGRVLPAQAFYFLSRMQPHDEILRSLGAAMGETPFGPFVRVDQSGQTGVPGLWAAGNVTDPGAQLVHAAAQGYRVGASLAATIALG